MTQREIIPLDHGEAGVYCAPNPAGESANEDAAIVIPLDASRAVLAVADGMGGQPAGDKAAEVALAAVAESVGSAPASGDGDGPGLRPAILDGFEAANERLTASGVGAGTTLAVVEIAAGSIRPYHVGDSDIVVIGQRGLIRLRTVSHSPVGYAVASGLLDARNAMHHEERHLVSNFVGTPEMRIEIGPMLQLQPRDTVLIGSDGLFDNLHLTEIADLVRTGPLEETIDDLASAARKRMLVPAEPHPSKLDDMTFILYRPRS